MTSERDRADRIEAAAARVAECRTTWNADLDELRYALTMASTPPRDEPAGDAREWREWVRTLVQEAWGNGEGPPGDSDVVALLALVGPPPSSAPLSPPVDAERERCARLCEDVADRDDEQESQAASMGVDVSAAYHRGRRHVARLLAETIRRPSSHPRTAPREQTALERAARKALARVGVFSEADSYGALMIALDALPEYVTPLPASPPLAPVESGKPYYLIERNDRGRAEWLHQNTNAWVTDVRSAMRIDWGVYANKVAREMTKALGLSLVATEHMDMSCPPPSPAEGSERAKAIETAALRIIQGPEGCVTTPPCGSCVYCDLVAALALPAGPPESDALYREVAREGYEVGHADGIADVRYVDGAEGDAARERDAQEIVARVLARRGR